MKRIITSLCILAFTITALAQKDFPPRIKDERVLIYNDLGRGEVVCASPDHDNPGEILVYYYIHNSTPADSVFLVFDKKGCSEMLLSLEQAKVKLDEWKKIAKKNKVTNFDKDIDIYFPPIDVFWRQTGPAIGEYTYYPFYIKSGKQHRLNPRLHVDRDGDVFIKFEFSVPDCTGKPYRMGWSISIPELKYCPEYFKYEKIKKAYIEKTPSREGWDELFK